MKQLTRVQSQYLMIVILILMPFIRSLNHLQDHLYWQLNLITLSNRDKDIAEAFIDSIDNNGFLTSELQEITAHLKIKLQTILYKHDELIAVLRRLQQFDPPGIFARDLKECPRFS